MTRNQSLNTLSLLGIMVDLHVPLCAFRSALSCAGRRRSCMNADRHVMHVLVCLFCLCSSFHHRSGSPELWLQLAHFGIHSDPFSVKAGYVNRLASLTKNQPQVRRSMTPFPFSWFQQPRPNKLLMCRGGAGAKAKVDSNGQDDGFAKRARSSSRTEAGRGERQDNGKSRTIRSFESPSSRRNTGRGERRDLDQSSAIRSFQTRGTDYAVDQRAKREGWDEAKRGGRPNGVQPARNSVDQQTSSSRARVQPTVDEPADPIKSPATRTSSSTRSEMTNARFDALEISPKTKKAIAEVFGYELMTTVQEKTIPTALTGIDMLAKAKTGTGKTLAFLIPAIEHAVQAKQAGHAGIKVLVISPTRELATQIFEEAKALSSFHELHTQVMVGGTNINKDLKALTSRAPDILIATPERLNDHLSSGPPLLPLLRQLKVLVFDEADQLLDMGFRPAIETMLRALGPKETRQTLLLSATMPQDISDMRRVAMRADQKHFAFIDTVILSRTLPLAPRPTPL
jgi:hypothetical protein